MAPPYVGVMEKTEALMYALNDLHGFCNEELIAAHTVMPIEQLREDYREGRVSSFVAQERLRQILDQIDETFGLQYEPTWQQVRDGKFVDFDGAYSMPLWCLYVEDPYDAKILRELADYDLQTDPVELARAALGSMSLLVLDIFDSDCIFIFESEAIGRGRHARNTHMGCYWPCPLEEIAYIDRDGFDGNVPCYTLPEKVLREVERFEQEEAAWEAQHTAYTQSNRR